MPGVGNGPAGCPCGVLRDADQDPIVAAFSSGFLTTGGKGEAIGDQSIPRRFRPSETPILRACRACLTVYAVAENLPAPSGPAEP